MFSLPVLNFFDFIILLLSPKLCYKFTKGSFKLEPKADPIEFSSSDPNSSFRESLSELRQL